MLSWIIVGWTLTGFFNLDFTRIRRALTRWELWLLFGFFFMTLLSAYFSDDISEALFSIEVKLSFLLFPFLIFCFRWPVVIIKRCIMSFVSGCFFASLILVVRGVYYYLNGQPDELFYNNFSVFIHTSYFSMYLNLAIAFVFILYPSWFSSQRAVLRSAYLFVLLFVITIFLCSSKLGIISFIFTAFFIILYRLKTNFNLKRSLFVLSGFGILLIAGCFLFPASLGRLSMLANFDADNVDKTAIESTAVRVLIWKQSAELIRQNFFFGTGVGDANAQLYAAYEKHGLSGAFSHKLNAHNQYLQTFIGMGFFSFLLLAVITLGEMIRSIIRKQFLLFIFSFLITLNFLVESMLQRAAGVVFFTFFYCFLNLVKQGQFLMNENEEI